MSRTARRAYTAHGVTTFHLDPRPPPPLPPEAPGSDRPLPPSVRRCNSRRARDVGLLHRPVNLTSDFPERGAALSLNDSRTSAWTFVTRLRPVALGDHDQRADRLSGLLEVTNFGRRSPGRPLEQQD